MNCLRPLSSFIYPALKTLGADIIFRHLNRNKMLILGYHGLTSNRYDIPPVTLLHVEHFERQIQHITRHYNVISLRRAAEHIASGENFPNNTAVITFDDGYRNNLTLALPILEKYGAPATVFVTAGYVGDNKILPFDEVFLIVTDAARDRSGRVSDMRLSSLRFNDITDMAYSYHAIMTELKTRTVDDQKKYIVRLRKSLGIEQYTHPLNVIEDFNIVNPDELLKLSGSDLIDIGSHTVNHQILSKTDLDTAAREISYSRILLEKFTGKTVDLFAYPNGRASDFSDDHVACLIKSGYICSVTLVPKFNSPCEDLHHLGRMCIGHDFGKDIASFAIKTSGLNIAFRSLY